MKTRTVRIWNYDYKTKCPVGITSIEYVNKPGHIVFDSYRTIEHKWIGFLSRRQYLNEIPKWTPKRRPHYVGHGDIGGRKDRPEKFGVAWIGPDDVARSKTFYGRICLMNESDWLAWRAEKDNTPWSERKKTVKGLIDDPDPKPASKTETPAQRDKRYDKMSVDEWMKLPEVERNRYLRKPNDQLLKMSKAALNLFVAKSKAHTDEALGRFKKRTSKQEKQIEKLDKAIVKNTEQAAKTMGKVTEPVSKGPTPRIPKTPAPPPLDKRLFAGKLKFKEAPRRWVITPAHEVPKARVRLGLGRDIVHKFFHFKHRKGESLWAVWVGANGEVESADTGLISYGDVEHWPDEMEKRNPYAPEGD